VLVGALSRATEPLVLVSAPAGAGKTTVLLEWTQHQRRPYAWLRLDEDDNDPVVLLRYLARALQDIAVVETAVMDAPMLSVPTVVERVLARIEVALAEAAPFLLVLDDAHRLTNKACWRIVESVLERLPAGAQLAVGTRADPPLALARMRAASAVAEVRAAELAFDRSEADALLRLNKVEIDVASLDALLAATQGWAAGLALASLAGKGRPVEEWLPQIRGDQSDIAAYLSSEILNAQPASVRDFLVQTSILERLSPASCRAVTGRDDAHEMLERLVADNLFLTELGDRGDCYRYSPLFAQFLRRELARRDPEETARLHASAARWCMTQGMIPEAVRHWLKAGDTEAAATAVAESWTWYWERGQIETVHQMLESFSREQVLAHPPLTLTAGWVFTALADAPVADYWASRACNARVDDVPAPDGAASLRSSQALLRAMLARDGISAMRRDAELAARHERIPGSSWHVDTLETLGRARWLSGMTAQAIDPLNVAARDAIAFNWAAQVSALGLLSLIAADRGDWELAEEYDDKARSRLAELGIEIPRRALPAFLARARILAHRVDPGFDRAVSDVAQILDRMNPLPWMDLLAFVVLGEASLEQRDLRAVERWSARALAALKRYPDAGILEERTQRLRFAVERLRWTDPITAAERRVLELLPTHLTLEQIATRLFLSKNTVKTHLRDLYRKLEVGSRTDAVDKARELGLLPPC
jgi:LuxR family maltose regulon positive regulatory protein